MAKFRWINDSYKRVASIFCLDMLLKIDPTRQDYQKQIKVDLENRDKNANFYESIATIRKHLADDSQLPDEKLSYTQGNFSGRAFTEVLYSFFYSSFLAAKISEDTVEPKRTSEDNDESTLIPAKSLSFTYINDRGQYCGFSIMPWYDGTNNPETEQSKYMYVIAHISDVEKSLEERQVTVFMSNDMLPEKISEKDFDKEFGNPIDASDISQELVLMLESSSITQLLSGLIDKKGALNLKKFCEIKDRLKGTSIDDRDAKMQIWGQIILWAKLTEESLTTKDKQDLKANLTEMLTQQDYFLKHTKEDLEAYLKLFKEPGMVTNFLPLKSQQEEFVNSVLGRMDEFLQQKKQDDAEKFNVVKLYGYTSYQEWLDAKNLPLYSRIPHFTKVLGLTVAVGLTLAGLAASGVLIVPVAIALAVAFVGLCSWLAKKVYSLRIDDKKIEEKIATITETNQIEEKTKTAVTEILGDGFAKVLQPKPRVQPSSFFQPNESADGDEEKFNSDLSHSSSKK